MGYLADGKPIAFFIRLSDDDLIKAQRLLYIIKRTNNKRIKKKLAKRIDNMVKVE
ncbi:hypothetical protein LCM23_25145 [Cytobacillus kochii]|uniref:hypothetical protein n=1 Tax=Cytobacillus kochii TaxID=859143 RepID=UPI001CD6627A|nr:hypothetical protein [Cytobacillus kochii]MCA1029302.1 hypothetical protein [Cytobacillus kochii]